MNIASDLNFIIGTATGDKPTGIYRHLQQLT